MSYTAATALGLLVLFNTLAVVLILLGREYAKALSLSDTDTFHSVILISIRQHVCFTLIIGILLGIGFGLNIIPDNYYELIIGSIAIVIGVYKLVRILVANNYLKSCHCCYTVAGNASESESESSPLRNKEKGIYGNSFITTDNESKNSFVEIDLEANIGTEGDESTFDKVDSLLVDYPKGCLEIFPKNVQALCLNPLILEVGLYSFVVVANNVAIYDVLLVYQITPSDVLLVLFLIYVLITVYFIIAAVIITKCPYVGDIIGHYGKCLLPHLLP